MSLRAQVCICVHEQHWGVPWHAAGLPAVCQVQCTRPQLAIGVGVHFMPNPRSHDWSCWSPSRVFLCRHALLMSMIHTHLTGVVWRLQSLMASSPDCLDASFS